MSTYFTVSAVFTLLGIYIFALCRWWFRHLTDLAARYDLSERRKHATRRYLVVLLLAFVPIFGAVFGSFTLAPKLGVFVIGMFACLIASAVMWWVRRMPKLYALGYGRRWSRSGFTERGSGFKL